MKKLFLLLVLSLPLLTWAQEKKPYLTRSLGSDNIKEVIAQTSGGSITVLASPTSEARLEVFVQPGNGKEELSQDQIKQRLDENYDFSISVASGKLSAIAKQKKDFNDWKRSLSISYKVFVPKNVSTELATSGGSIHLTGLAGKQDFATSGGSLHVDGLTGNIKGRTSGGSIHLKNSADDIDLRTSGGSIEASNCKGTIRLNTSGGGIRLSDLDGKISVITSGGSITGATIGGELEAMTSGGSVKMEDLSCSLEASTSGGHITVAMTSLGKYVNIRNSAGSIDLTLPKDKGMNLDFIANRVKTDNKLTNFSGRMEDDRIDGKLNGGGVPVKVQSSSGRINLAFK